MGQVLSWTAFLNRGERVHLTVRRRYQLRENEVMSGIQFVTDEKGRKVGVLIDLKKHEAIWEDFRTVLYLNRAGRKRAFLTSNTAQPA